MSASRARRQQESAQRELKNCFHIFRPLFHLHKHTLTHYAVCNPGAEIPDKNLPAIEWEILPMIGESSSKQAMINVKFHMENGKSISFSTSISRIFEARPKLRAIGSRFVKILFRDIRL
jgi:hypothetical protein